MTVQHTKVSFAPRVTTGTQDVTAAGFPNVEAFMLYYTNDPTLDAVMEPNAVGSIGGGSWNGSTFDLRSTGHSGLQHGSFQSITFRFDQDTRALIVINPSNGNIAGTATVTRITNGIRLSWVWNAGQAPASARLATAVFFGDDTDVTSAIGLVSNSSSPFTATVSIGFRADVIFFFGSRTGTSTATSGGTRSHASLSYGVASRDPVTSAVSQVSMNMVVANKSGFPSEGAFIWRSNAVVQNLFTSSPGFGGMVVSSIGATSFSILPISTIGGPTGGTSIYYLALKFGTDAITYRIINAQTPTTPGFQNIAVAFQPQTIFGIASRVSSNGVIELNDASTFGIGVATYNGAVYDNRQNTWLYDDGAITPQTARSFRTDTLLEGRPDDGSTPGSYIGSPLTYTKGSSQLVLNWTAVDPTPRNYAMLLLSAESQATPILDILSVYPSATVSLPSLVVTQDRVRMGQSLTPTATVEAPASVETAILVGLGVLAPVGASVSSPSSVHAAFPIQLILIAPVATVSAPADITTLKTYIVGTRLDPTADVEAPTLVQTPFPITLGALEPTADVEAPVSVLAGVRITLTLVSFTADVEAPADVTTDKTYIISASLEPTATVEAPADVSTPQQIDLGILAPVGATTTPPSSVSVTPVTSIDISALDKKVQVIIAKLWGRP